jgi:hypothetical protein
MVWNVMKSHFINSHSVSVYSVLFILRNMRRDLGLEAMSEFIDLYVTAAEKRNPQLKEILCEVLTERAINKFYQAVVHHENG